MSNSYLSSNELETNDRCSDRESIVVHTKNASSRVAAVSVPDMHSIGSSHLNLTKETQVVVGELRLAQSTPTSLQSFS